MLQNITQNDFEGDPGRIDPYIHIPVQAVKGRDESQLNMAHALAWNNLHNIYIYLEY